MEHFTKTPAHLMDMLRSMNKHKPGAIEIQFIDGPALTGVDYQARGELLALSESPKTELSWYEVTLSDPDGRDVVRMLKMDRLMKAASPLWSEEGR